MTVYIQAHKGYIRALWERPPTKRGQSVDNL